MGKAAPHITAAELKVMKSLWHLRSATVRQVLDDLTASGDSKPAYTTIMTMMNQLAEKGALKVDRQRQPFIYKPAVGRERVLSQRLTQFLQTVFDGQAEDLVLHLAEDANLSADDLRRIQAKIKQREQADAETDAAPPEPQEGASS